jgi:glutamate 5-kinase
VGVDTGAREALVSKGRSLLAAGVREVDGDFVAGDIVDVAVDGAVFARGIVGFSADELRRIAGRGSSDIAGLLGIEVAREVVHRDELVVL